MDIYTYFSHVLKHPVSSILCCREDRQQKKQQELQESRAWNTYSITLRIVFELKWKTAKYWQRWHFLCIKKSSRTIYLLPLILFPGLYITFLNKLVTITRQTLQVHSSLILPGNWRIGILNLNTLFRPWKHFAVYIDTPTSRQVRLPTCCKLVFQQVFVRVIQSPFAPYLI